MTAAAIAGATGNANKDTGNDNGWDIGGGCEGSREQCAVRDPSRDGSRGPGHVLNGDNTDENKQPNLGKEVASATDKEKAELGGAGAGRTIRQSSVNLVLFAKRVNCRITLLLLLE